MTDFTVNCFSFFLFDLSAAKGIQGHIKKNKGLGYHTWQNSGLSVFFIFVWRRTLFYSLHPSAHTARFRFLSESLIKNARLGSSCPGSNRLFGWCWTNVSQKLFIIIILNEWFVKFVTYFNFQQMFRKFQCFCSNIMKFAKLSQQTDSFQKETRKKNQGSWSQKVHFFIENF